MQGRIDWNENLINGFQERQGINQEKAKWDKKQLKMLKEKAVEIEHRQRRNDNSISRIPDEENQYNLNIINKSSHC